ncbi:MAG TPA: rhomboid family intramembrane serine protease, partial [Bacteroidales bacterium]|nr:rhomboid family intramembrane serine protease [Bacteroidales bacterium]
IIFPIPIGIPAWVFGIFYLIFSYYQSKRSKDNIAHDVHLYGSLFGILYLTLVKPAIFLHFINAIF